MTGILISSRAFASSFSGRQADNAQGDPDRTALGRFEYVDLVMMANRWRPVKLKRFDIPGHPNGTDRTTARPYRSMSPLDTILIY